MARSRPSIRSSRPGGSHLIQTTPRVFGANVNGKVPIRPRLAFRNALGAPDLRDFGWTDVPASGYDRVHFVGDLVGLLLGLCVDRVRMVPTTWEPSSASTSVSTIPESISDYVSLNLSPRPPTDTWGGAVLGMRRGTTWERVLQRGRPTARGSGLRPRMPRGRRRRCSIRCASQGRSKRHRGRDSARETSHTSALRHLRADCGISGHRSRAARGSRRDPGTTPRGSTAGTSWVKRIAPAGSIHGIATSSKTPAQPAGSSPLSLRASSGSQRRIERPR